MTEKESNEYKEPSGPSDGHFLFSDRQLEVAKWRWAFIRLDRNYQKHFRQWHGTSRDVVFAARWWLRELIDPKLTFDDICKEYEAPKYADVSESKKEYWVIEKLGGGAVRAIASVNREISCLHHIFTKAVEWEMIERSPFDRGKSLLSKENNKRFRYLDQDEIDRLLESCVNYYTSDITVAAINTGMRRQEILTLKWGQITGGFIYLSKTKTDDPRQIPINDDLADLFKDIRKKHQLRSEYVFCDDKGKSFKDIKVSFNASLKGAGIEDFTFRDLRHTFASHFVMKGGSLKELQKILGHKNITMTMRYAHLSQEHKKKAVNLLNGLTASAKGICHKTVTSPKSSVIGTR